MFKTRGRGSGEGRNSGAGGISTGKIQMSYFKSKTNIHSKFHANRKNRKVFIIKGICSGGWENSEGRDVIEKKRFGGQGFGWSTLCQTRTSVVKQEDMDSSFPFLSKWEAHIKQLNSLLVQQNKRSI